MRKEEDERRERELYVTTTANIAKLKGMTAEKRVFDFVIHTRVHSIVNIAYQDSSVHSV